MPAALLERFYRNAVFKKIPANAIVYSQGDPCRYIAFIISGNIRVYKTGASGREITLYEIGSGETCILNASCILSGADYPANAVATEGSEALMLAAEEFRRFISECAEVRDFVFAALSGRLSVMMALVEEVAFGRMFERVWQYITERAHNGGLSITHQKIADDLGSSREVISRVLKDFERRGRITLSRNFIRIDNP
ncbi:MAG: Crp/Fnr family transcriptional regulator [Actinomycetota bacterium]|nr:Crp/Fnr family transcriptional regulator [Actinomycetota bacterium]